MTAIPPHLASKTGAPMIMLNMSRDHQLFYKAYNEYSDLMPDVDMPGVNHYGYIPRYKYYGYFDSNKCYSYVSTAIASTLNNVSSTRYFTPGSKVVAGGNHYCSGTADEWSGNFLNWITMTRIDVVRKILYGGYRVVDSATPGKTATILQRAHLPQDAHSFAKYYKGTDIRKLTPWDSNGEISFCNTTDLTSGYSHSVNLPAPIFRVAKGNFQLWSATDGKEQCNWGTGSDGNNGNDPALTGLNAAKLWPTKSANGLGAYDYHVSVAVCSDSTNFSDDEKQHCRAYSSGSAVNYKPIGLLQVYGEKDDAEFGLMTGSYDRNTHGGVLRKNISSFLDEVNLSNGTFVTPGDKQSIRYTLDNLRVFGWNGGYAASSGADADNCGLTPGIADGRCASWGNPISEIYLESLRYLAGLAANTTFTAGHGIKEGQISGGLPAPAWKDPFNYKLDTKRKKYGELACRPTNVINFNVSVSSYDDDDVAGFSDLTSASPPGIKPGSGSLSNFTDEVGLVEGLYSKKWFTGKAASGDPLLCTSKTVSALSSVRGICPEAPAYNGSYYLAGAALYAHVNRIRSSARNEFDAVIAPDAGNKKAFKVNTFGVSLSTGVPTIEVPNPGGGAKIRILPAYYVLNGGSNSYTSAQLVDFRLVSMTSDPATNTYTGKYMVQWDDGEHGNDYDLDAWGTIEYQVLPPNRVKVITKVGYAAAGYSQDFGYTISGTDGKDGAHFHSGHNGGAKYNDPTSVKVYSAGNVELNSTSGTAVINASGGCNNCKSSDGPTSVTYTFANGLDVDVLKDPLWYAAKYGNFKGAGSDSNKYTYAYTSGVALSSEQWDSKKTDGTAGSDGVPDGYFFAIDPGQLEVALKSAFEQALKAGGAAPVAAGPVLTTDAMIYRTRFDSSNSSGDLVASKLDPDGSELPPDWKASETLLPVKAGDRKIFTRVATGGVEFSKSDSNFMTAYQVLLGKNGSGTTDNKYNERIDYLRGDQTNEYTAANPGGVFRSRGNQRIGAIVNSTPWYMGAPNNSFSGADYGGDYKSFLTANKDRKVVFVAANDGMLHAFDGNAKAAGGGSLLFSYVPGAIVKDMPKLSDVSYTSQAFFDGSPFAADFRNSAGDWKTYVFAPLGRGGRSIVALDVTAGSGQLGITKDSAGATKLAKWEFSDSVDSDLGYVLARPQMAGYNNRAVQVMPVSDGGSGTKWVVAFGNGYNSEADKGSGRAALFLIKADAAPSGSWTGADYTKVVTSSEGDGPNNGLGTPYPMDTDNDGLIDTIYAGDLKGNLWKFVYSKTADSWGVDGGKPLYIAKDSSGKVQPISGNLGAVRHPLGGYIVNFATGKLLEAADASSSQQHTVYGIWDRAADARTSANYPPRERENLQAQTLSSASSGGATYKISSNTAIADWTSKNGWYMDFNVPQEQVISGMQYTVPGLQLMFPSVIPAVDANQCDPTNSGYIYLLDPVSGTSKTPSFDTDNDGAINSKDKVNGVIPAAVLVDGATGMATLIRSTLKRGITLVETSNSNTNDGGQGKGKEANGGEGSGRLFWREVQQNQ